MRNLKIDSQHFLCSLHFVVDSDLHKFPEMSRFLPNSLAFQALHTVCTILILCSFPLPMCVVIKINHIFFPVIIYLL